MASVVVLVIVGVVAIVVIVVSVTAQIVEREPALQHEPHYTLPVLTALGANQFAYVSRVHRLIQVSDRSLYMLLRQAFCTKSHRNLHSSP